MPLLLDWFLQPLGLVFTGLFISQLWLFWLPRVPRSWKLFLAASIVLLWVSSAPLTSNALVWQIEKPDYVIDEACFVEQNSALVDRPVVVLGADLDAYVASDNPYEVLSHESLLRTQHSVSLDTGNNRYYLSGGGQTSRKLSDFMALVLIDRGIDNERIVREKFSLSTREHAQELLALIDPANAMLINLVTSSLHMNRAVALFVAEGFIVCPSAAGSQYSVSSGWVGLLPYISGLNKTTHAWRELLATIKFRLEFVIGL